MLHVNILQMIYIISNFETHIRFLYFYTIERNFASVTRPEGAPLKYYLCHLQLRLERAQSIFEIKFKTENREQPRLPIFRNVTRTSEHVAMQEENYLKTCETDSYSTTYKCDGKVIKWKLVIWRQSNGLSWDQKDSYLPSPSKAKGYWWEFWNFIRSQLNPNAFNLLPSNVCKKLDKPNKIMKEAKRAFNRSNIFSNDRGWD